MTRDPHRWLEDSAADPRLTGLLRSSADPLDLPAAVESRVGDALQQLANTAPVTSMAAATKPGVLAAMATKPLVIVGSLATTALVVGLAWHPQTRRSAFAPSPSVVAPVQIPELIQPASVRLLPTATVSDLPLEPEAAASAGPHARTATQSSPSSLADEAQLLERMRASIANDPAAARRTLARYDAKFPHGILREERALLAVKLAVAEGRRGEAKAQATELENTAKGSPYTKKAREVVDSNERAKGSRTITE
ncbi:MAG TPA: hypothetical protein VIV60_01995 [Polyangiaceae bacterium]